MAAATTIMAPPTVPVTLRERVKPATKLPTMPAMPKMSSAMVIVAASTSTSSSR